MFGCRLDWRRRRPWSRWSLILSAEGAATANFDAAKEHGEDALQNPGRYGMPPPVAKARPLELKHNVAYAKSGNAKQRGRQGYWRPKAEDNKRVCSNRTPAATPRPWNVQMVGTKWSGGKWPSAKASVSNAYWAGVLPPPPHPPPADTSVASSSIPPWRHYSWGYSYPTQQSPAPWVVVPAKVPRKRTASASAQRNHHSKRARPVTARPTPPPSPLPIPLVEPASACEDDEASGDRRKTRVKNVEPYASPPSTPPCEYDDSTDADVKEEDTSSSSSGSTGGLSGETAYRVVGVHEAATVEQQSLATPLVPPDGTPPERSVFLDMPLAHFRQAALQALEPRCVSPPLRDSIDRIIKDHRYVSPALAP